MSYDSAELSQSWLTHTHTHTVCSIANPRLSSIIQAQRDTQSAKLNSYHKHIGYNATKTQASPVLRGEDEPETFSCQLYFFPKELLFNVSWKKKEEKKKEEVVRTMVRKTEEKTGDWSLNAGP